MEVFNSSEKEGTKIESFPYRGKPLPVKDVEIQWLTQAGPSFLHSDHVCPERTAVRMLI
jgi:hypothetical protein